MNRQIRCAHCRCRFVPNPRIKTQRFCSAKPCQLARKTQWQREKMATDPDYQANQRDGQSAWRKSHRDYWRQYRQEHPAVRKNTVRSHAARFSSPYSWCRPPKTGRVTTR